MAKEKDEEEKRDSLIISYYLSRCNQALKVLGFNSFNEAFKELGKLLDENPNNIKNRRDEFDPYFDNGRAGWYQRKLRPSRQQIFDEMAVYSDDELGGIVKNILKKYEVPSMSEDSCALQDLGALIKQSTIHYNQEFAWQDVILTDEFKNAYEEYLDGIKWKIEYYDATSVITTPTSKNIYLPNQWFVLASYAVGVYEELSKYKNSFEFVSDEQNEKKDVYAKQLRDNPSSVDKAGFITSGLNLLNQEGFYGGGAEKAAKRLWRFATDYSWWSGQKTIDRGDFYVSVVLNMLNLVNASQGYVADIVNAYATDEHLKSLTEKLEYFTKNMEGVTYNLKIQPEDAGYIKAENPQEKESSEQKTSTHRISISQKSIDKIGGKK